MVESGVFLDSCIVQVNSSTKGLLLLCLNIVLPGTGTLMSSCMDSSFNILALICGVLQLAMAILVIGWLWSIFHGYAIYVASCQQSSQIVRQASEEGSDEDAE